MFSWRLRYDTDQLFRTFFLSLVGTKILYEEFFKHFYIWTKIVLIIQLSPKVMLCLKWLHLCKDLNEKYAYIILYYFSSSVQFSSVAQLCPNLCNPMDCSTPGFPVHHQLPELAQTYVHLVSDVIQPSHPLLSPSPAFNLSQHQGLF